MAKKVVNQVKLQIPAGRANPSPPIGPLSVLLANIPMFCKEFNARTRRMWVRVSSSPPSSPCTRTAHSPSSFARHLLLFCCSRRPYR